MQNTPTFVAPGSIRIRGGQTIQPSEFQLALDATNARLDAIVSEDVAA